MKIENLIIGRKFNTIKLFCKVTKSMLALLLIISITFSGSQNEGKWYGFNMFTSITDIFAASVNTYGYSKNGKWAYKIINKEKKTVAIRPSAHNKNSSKITIPEQINIGNSKYTVVRIGSFAFNQCSCEKCLKKIGKTLKATWENDEKVFFDANKNTVWINCTRKHINHYFSYGAKEVEIPKTVKMIGKYAFADNKNLKKVTFASDSQLENIKDAAFADSGLSEITLPQSLEEVGSNAFSHTLLKKITIPEKVKNIGCAAFSSIMLNTVTFKQKNKFNFSNICSFLTGELQQVNIENYEIYEFLKENNFFDMADAINIYCAQTRLYINGKKITSDIKMDASKSATIDLNIYNTSKKGFHFEATSVKYISSIEKRGEILQYIAKKDIKNNKIVSYGYLRMNVGADIVENQYNIEYPGYSLFSNITAQKDNDGKFSAYKVKYSDQITFSNYPTGNDYKKTGYHIDGYRLVGTNKTYKEKQSVKSLTDKHNEKVKIELDYAPNKYEVTYNGNASGVSTEYIIDQKCQYDKEFIITDEIPVRKGYKFKGWCTDKYGKAKIYQIGDKFKNLTEDNNATVTLYAIWEEGLFDMYFDANGGELSQVSMQVAYESTIGKSLPVPEREGYDFVKWTTGRTGGKTVDSTYVVSFLSDFTVYAQWKEKVYTVTFDGNGGTLAQSSKKVDYDQSIGLLPKPTKDGYVFDGWYTSKDGGNKISAVTKIKENVTFYAHWLQKTKRIRVKVTPPSGKKVSGYEVWYTKNGELDFKNTFATSAMLSLPITINGAKSGEVYVIKARYYVLKKGKKKWSKVTTKVVNVD